MKPYLLYFFPLFSCRFFFSIEPANDIKKLITLGLFSVLSVILVLFVSSSTLEKSEAHNMYSILQANIEHPLRRDAFNVLHRSSKTNYEIMKNIRSSKTYYSRLAESFFVTIPVFLVFISFLVFILMKSKTKYYLIILSVLASVSPLLLHFFGWDMHRWNTLAVTTSFLMLYVLYTSKTKNQLMTTPNNIYPIFIFMIFFNGVSLIDLFDEYYVKQFPFLEHKQYILDFISEKEAFPYVPKH